MPCIHVQEGNWPLLTVTKGFFETLAAKGKALDAANKPAAAAAAATGINEEELEAGGWGDDLDLGLGGGEVST